MNQPVDSNGGIIRKDWQLLDLEGSADKLEACLGLLTPWVKGAGTVVINEISGSSRLEVYIDAQDRPRVEQAWANWTRESIPALQDVFRDWSPVPPEAWRMEWRGHFPPLTVTENITIVPDWNQTASAPILIRLHPGMAFGTGHHATTQMMIRQLEQLGCSGKRVLDLGAGSGVLAIAALLLGAGQVIAVEQDPICEDNFYQNLELNDLAGRADFVLGDAAAWLDFNYDLALANIQRSVILEILNNFAGTDSGALLILSGLLREEETRLVESCQRNNLKLEKIKREEEWLSAVVGR
ncbi:50S ribosomal protein L11 methyltransferase [Candidatus Neomarinimicrobiota bacterium]